MTFSTPGTVQPQPKRRVAVASIWMETNTFSPRLASIDDFRGNYWYEGDEIDRLRGMNTEVAGVLEQLEADGIEPVPLLATSALSKGTLGRAAFETLCGRLCDLVRSAGSLDGVVLCLHGALCAEDYDHADAEIVRRVRSILVDGSPIAVSLDLHANVVSDLVQSDTFFVGYRTYPHVDQAETGWRCASLLARRLSGEADPVMRIAKLPLILSSITARTDVEPLATIRKRADALCAEAGLLDISLFPVQPWLDLPVTGVAVSVCGDGDPDSAREAADTVAGWLWEARAGFAVDLPCLDDVIRQSLEWDGRTVIGDPGDAPSSGSCADDPGVLRTLLSIHAQDQSKPIFLTLCDPPATQRAAQLGLGEIASFTLGHAYSGSGGDPVRIEARIEALTSGDYLMQDPGARGQTMRMGPTTLLRIGSIHLLVRSQPAFEWDTAMYPSVGLDLSQGHLIFVKSPSHFRISYAAVADRILVADTPGYAPARVERIPFSRLRLPFD